MGHKRLCGIYRLICPNGQSYIGQAIDIRCRWSKYRRLYGNVYQQRKLYNALVKYGPLNFQYEILRLCSRESLDKYEVLFIEQFDSINNGLNLQIGGLGNVNPSAETRSKLSVKTQQAWTTSEFRNKVVLRWRNRAPKYRFIHISGLIKEPGNVSEFCTDFSLLRSCVGRLVSGELKTYRGWSVEIL